MKTALIIIIWAVGYLQREICEKKILESASKRLEFNSGIQNNKKPCHKTFCDHQILDKHITHNLHLSLHI